MRNLTDNRNRNDNYTMFVKTLSILWIVPRIQSIYFYMIYFNINIICNLHIFSPQLWFRSESHIVYCRLFICLFFYFSLYLGCYCFIFACFVNLFMGTVHICIISINEDYFRKKKSLSFFLNSEYILCICFNVKKWYL